MHRTDHKRLERYSSQIFLLALGDVTHHTGKRINNHPIALPPLPGIRLGPQCPLPPHPHQTPAALLPAAPSRKTVPYLLRFSLYTRRTPEAGPQSMVGRRDGLEAGFRKRRVEPAGFAHVWVVKTHEFKV